MRRIQRHWQAKRDRKYRDRVNNIRRLVRYGVQGYARYGVQGYETPYVLPQDMAVLNRAFRYLGVPVNAHYLENPSRVRLTIKQPETPEHVMTLDDLQTLTEFARSAENQLRRDFPEYGPLIKLELTRTGIEVRCGAWGPDSSFDKAVVLTWPEIHAAVAPATNHIQYVADAMRVALKHHERTAS